MDKTDVNYTENLINAMIDYGLDDQWNDSDIIDMLIECGITEEDFKNYGFGDFVKAYFSDSEED